MMRLLVSAFVLGASAQGALALSCIPMSVEALYTRAAEATDSYVPVVGTLTDVSLSPKPRPDPDFPAGEVGQARFNGHYISSAGELKAWSAQVMVETHCLASWCGGVPEGQELLGFLRMSGSAYVFDGHACPQVIAPATPGDVSRMQGCLAGEDCTPEF